MPGFFDKIKEAVGDLTRRVEESGVIDELKEAAGGGESGSTESAAQGDAAEEGMTSGSGSGAPHGWAAAVDRAGLDPMELLTAAEAAAAVGLPLDRSYEQMDDEWFGVTWIKDGGGPYVEARFTHGYTDGSPVDLEGMWQFVTLEAGATTPVDVDSRVEAGSDEYHSVYVRTPSHLFYVVSGGLPDGVETADVHRKIAQALVGRLLD